MRRLRKLANYFSQLNDLKVWRTILPVVYPADDKVAAAGIVAMGEEVAAIKLKLKTTREDKALEIGGDAHSKAAEDQKARTRTRKHIAADEIMSLQ